MTSGKTRVALAGVALGFVAATMLFLPRLGIEADEAMIGNGIFEHGAPWYSWKIGANEIPVMLIGYLGALKTWLFNPYFLAVRPGPVSLRLPMAILAAGTLWLFFALLDRVAGRKAAWIGMLLLATDTSYFLISMMDFGFVVFQFLFKLAALILLLRFHESGSRGALAGAFFLLGLALWDKAVFVWVLFGFAVAGGAVYWGEIRRHLSVRNLAIAAMAMIAGALPLIVYNVERPLETLRSNAKVGGEPVWGKAVVLEGTLDGNVLFGFLTAAEPGPKVGEAKHWFQAVALWFADVTRHPHFNLILPALVLALGFCWQREIRRPMLFAVICCVATWLAMALTHGAGAAAHHTILLWPFPQMILALAVSRISVKWASAATALLCLANVAVTNQYYADLLRNGPAIRWTDAIDSLNRYLAESKANRIYAADWGFIETLNLISEGDQPVYELDLADAANLKGMIAARDGVFVAHTAEFEILPEWRAAVEAEAKREGYEEQKLATISDLEGRPTFEVFRFRKLHL